MLPGAFHHHAFFDGGAGLQGSVGVDLQRNGSTAAEAFIGGDDDVAFAVLYAPRQGVG